MVQGQGDALPAKLHIRETPATPPQGAAWGAHYMALAECQTLCSSHVNTWFIAAFEPAASSSEYHHPQAAP